MPPVVILSTQLFENITSSNQIQAGGTGKTIEYVTGGKYIEIRSARDETQNNIFRARINKNYLQPNSWFVITGHYEDASSLGGKTLSKDNKMVDVTRSPEDYVEAAMDCGLKHGDTANILLYACYGAAETATEKSFAQRLAEAFAKQGIHSHIVASTEMVNRHAVNEIEKHDDKKELRFCGGRTKKENIKVFDTMAKQPLITNITQPNDDFIISNQGMNFSSANSFSEKDRKNFQPITKDFAEAQLKTAPQGFYIIRPSSQTNQLVLSFKDDQGKIMHSYITSENDGKYSITVNNLKIGPEKNIDDLAKLFYGHLKYTREYNSHVERTNIKLQLMAQVPVTPIITQDTKELFSNALKGFLLNEKLDEAKTNNLISRLHNKIFFERKSSIMTTEFTPNQILAICDGLEKACKAINIGKYNDQIVASTKAVINDLKNDCKKKFDPIQTNFNNYEKRVLTALKAIDTKSINLTSQSRTAKQEKSQIIILIKNRLELAKNTLGDYKSFDEVQKYLKETIEPLFNQLLEREKRYQNTQVLSSKSGEKKIDELLSSEKIVRKM
ncbi:MAG: hypothetical protein ACD_46C00161G0004 [uncultured bacterium]|nr:MAG: hypothetical protein ACD_46C00161G0004 [uncultured bacterium]